MSTLAKSTILVTISEIVFNVTSFLIHSVVGRILGPADYGRYGLVVTLTTMIIILIGNGIPTAMSKYISEIFDTNPRLVGVIKKQAIILQSIIIGSITLVFFISSPAIAYALGDPTLTPLFRLSTLIIPAFAAASFYFSYYTGLHRFGIQSFLKIARSIFRVIFILGLAYLFHVEGSIMGYVLAPLSVFLVAFLIDKFKVSRELSAAPAPVRDAYMRPVQAIQTDTQSSFDWRKLTAYAWQIVLFFLAYELLISIDLYLVKGILRDDYLTGVYNASLTLGRMPYYLFYALTVVLLPAISKSTAENNHEKTGKLISDSIRIMLILLIPTIALMSSYSEPLIRLFYGNKYIQAAAPMAILVWGIGFLTLFYVLSFVMNGAGKVKKPMILSVIGLLVNTVLNYIFIKLYGITGSAIATSITSALITVFMLFYIWKDFGVKIKILDFGRMLLAGGMIMLISYFLPGGKYLFVLWSGLLFGLYLLILYILGEIKKDDLKYFSKIFKE